MRNYHVKHKLMRPDLERKRQLKHLARALSMTVLVALGIAVWMYMSAREAKAGVESQLDHTERLLTSYMTTSAVQDETTIYSCLHKTYEVPK